MGSGNKRTKALLKAGEAEHAGPHTGSLQQPQNSQPDPHRQRIRHLCPLLSLPLTHRDSLFPLSETRGKLHHSDLIISTKTTLYREMHSPLNTPHASNASPRQVRVCPCPLGMTSHRCDSGFLSLCTMCLRPPPPSPFPLAGPWVERALAGGLPLPRANYGPLNLPLLTRFPPLLLIATAHAPPPGRPNRSSSSLPDLVVGSGRTARPVWPRTQARTGGPLIPAGR